MSTTQDKLEMTQQDKLNLLREVLSDRIEFSHKWNFADLILPWDEWPKYISSIHRKKKDRCFIYWHGQRLPYPASPYHFREFYLGGIDKMIEHQKDDLEEDIENH